MSDNFPYGSVIAPNTYVVLNVPENGFYAGQENYYEDKLGVRNGQAVLCLGEITNCPGHFLFVHGQNRTVVGNFHCDLFRPATDEDL